jgi:hypothetical protein
MQVEIHPGSAQNIVPQPEKSQLLVSSLNAPSFVPALGGPTPKPPAHKPQRHREHRIDGKSFSSIPHETPLATGFSGLEDVKPRGPPMQSAKIS